MMVFITFSIIMLAKQTDEMGVLVTDFGWMKQDLGLKLTICLESGGRFFLGY